MWILLSEGYCLTAVMVCLGTGVCIVMPSAGGKQGPERVQGVERSGVMEPCPQCNGQPWVAYSCCGPLHLPKHLPPAPFPSTWGAPELRGPRSLWCISGDRSLSTLVWSSVCSSSPKLQGSEYGKYGAGRAKESEATSASVSPVRGT